MRHLDWLYLAPKICQLALDAGAALMRIYTGSADTDGLVTYKPDDSPLTLADLASHHVIVNGPTHQERCST